MRSEKLDNAKAYTNLLLIRLHQRLREKISSSGRERFLHDYCQSRISSLEDEYTELTGRRLNK